MDNPPPWEPRHVQIELTWRCNCRCVHCYQDKHTLPGPTTEQLRGMFRELSDAGTMHITLTGGEPLVRADILEILRDIRAHEMGITLYSNGVLIDAAMAAELEDLVAVVEVSLLAGEPSLHDRLTRSSGAFDKTVRAISLLREREIDVVVKVPLLAPAYDTVRDIGRLATDLGATWSPDWLLHPTYSGQSYPLDYQCDEPTLRQFFTDFPEFNPQSGYHPDPGAAAGICRAARTFCFIDAEGTVYPCLDFKEASSRQTARSCFGDLSLGNIQKEPFSRFWEASPLAHAIRQASGESFQACTRCSALEGCQPCMAVNYGEHGTLFAPAAARCRATRIAARLFDPNFVPATEQA